MRADHDLGDKVDDGAGRLLRVVLSKQVAHVFSVTLRFLGYKPEYPGRQTHRADSFNQIKIKILKGGNRDAKLGLFPYFSFKYPQTAG